MAATAVSLPSTADRAPTENSPTAGQSLRTDYTEDSSSSSRAIQFVFPQARQQSSSPTLPTFQQLSPSPLPFQRLHPLYGSFFPPDSPPASPAVEYDPLYSEAASGRGLPEVAAELPQAKGVAELPAKAAVELPAKGAAELPAKGVAEHECITAIRLCCDDSNPDHLSAR